MTCSGGMCRPARNHIGNLVLVKGLLVQTRLRSRGGRVVFLMVVFFLKDVTFFFFSLPCFFSPVLCQSTNIYGGVVKYSRGGINTHYFPGTTMTYSCNNSYLPSTALTTATCNDQGQWAPWYPATPSCIKQCPKPVLGGNLTAKMSDKSMIVGSTITFNCSSGLVLNGSRLVICTPEGQWSAKVPVCVQGE